MKLPFERMSGWFEPFLYSGGETKDIAKSRILPHFEADRLQQLMTTSGLISVSQAQESEAMLGTG